MRSQTRTNTIRVLETIHRTLRIVGGQSIEDGSGDTGAFRDAAAERSLFYAPLGIASDAHGNLFIADGGNRRIREVTGIDYRYAIAPSRGLIYPAILAEKSDYRIAYVGNSAVWYNTDWDNSIEGNIEKTLNEDRALSPRVVHVSAVAGNEKLGATAEYADWLATVGAVDLVVLNLNAANVVSSFGDSQTETLPSPEEWTPKLTARRVRLASKHIPLVVVTFPAPYDLNPAESAYANVRSDLNLFNTKGPLVEEALNRAVRAHPTGL